MAQVIHESIGVVQRFQLILVQVLQAVAQFLDNVEKRLVSTATVILGCSPPERVLIAIEGIIAHVFDSTCAWDDVETSHPQRVSNDHDFDVAVVAPVVKPRHQVVVEDMSQFSMSHIVDSTSLHDAQVNRQSSFMRSSSISSRMN